MKKLVYVLAAVVVVAIVGFFVVAFSLGSIVKGGVNRVGPKITQSSVNLESAKISPFSGQGTLSNLTVGNPAGWTSPRAFALGEISIQVEPGSLRGDHIVVNSIVIDRPEITYETRLTTSNLQDLLKNIQEAAGAPKQDPNAKAEKQVKIEIKSFRLQNARITAIAAGNTATVDMPPLVMENLGSREGGLTPEQLSVAIMKEVTTQAVQAAAKVAMEKGLIQKGLNKILGGEK